jgi:hypothetical protein
LGVTQQIFVIQLIMVVHPMTNLFVDAQKNLVIAQFFWGNVQKNWLPCFGR